MPVYSSSAIINAFNKTCSALNKIIVMKNDKNVYYYDKRTRLFYRTIPHDYESHLDTAIDTCVTYFLTQEERNCYNYLILNSVYHYTVLNVRENLSLYTTLTTSPNSLTDFNRDMPDEIAYRDKILNLNNLTFRERTYEDKYTTSVYTYFIKHYRDVPNYVTCVFGREKQSYKCFEKVQTILGSVLTNPSERRLFFFYGSGCNSKTTMLELLSIIFSDYLEVFDFKDYLNNYFNLNVSESERLDNKRIFAFDNVDLDEFIDHSVNRNMLDGIKHTLICVVKKKPTLKQMYSLSRPCSVLHFPNRFGDANHAIEIDYPGLFTWIVQGSGMYLNNRNTKTTILYSLLTTKLDTFSANKF